MANIALSIGAATDEGEFKGKNARPTIKAVINDMIVDCLCDTGASITVMAEKTFKSIWNNWSLVRLPMPSHLRVTGITGHRIKVTDYVLMEMKLLGKVVRRPVLIVDGLEHTQMVLGWDTIREESIMIDGGEKRVFFKDRPKTDDWSVAELKVTRGMSLTPGAVYKVPVRAMAGERTIRKGQVGICSALPDTRLSTWEAVAEVNEQDEMTLCMVNYAEGEMHLQPGDTVAMMRNPEFWGEEVENLTEEHLDSLFGTIGDEPKEPKRGRIKKITAEDEAELKEKLTIKAAGAWKARYEELLIDYHDVISRSKFDLGFTNVIEHHIHMKDQVPIHTRQFRVPFEHEAILHEFVDELLRKGAIEPSRSPYNSPVFCVTKKPLPDAKPGDPLPLRCVLDYRRINERSTPDRYTMREVRECLDEVGRHGSKIFTAIDLTSGFWQQSLSEESRQYTAFTVPGKGTRYHWLVAPMGLQGSPASFARLMDYIMRGVKGLITYIDDVLVHTATHEKHIKQLEQTLLRFRKYGLKINIAKTIVATDEVQYLGYTLRPTGISPSKDKAAAIRDAKPPRTPKQIREFVGLCNYFRFLVKDFSRKAAPLIKLTRHNEGWKGGELTEEAKKSFEQLQKDLMEEPIVTLPKRDRPYILYTDGAAGDRYNPGGLGAVLMQEDEKGVERVIAYASRGLKRHEKNYSAFLLEMAAAVFGIDYFDTYLLGRRFTLVTDHKPLEKLSSVHKKTLNRLQQAMLEYDFVLRYKKGEDNAVADYLSRNVVVDALKATLEDEKSVEQEQLEDDKIAKVRRFIESEGKIKPEDPSEAKWVEKTAADCFVENGLVWHTLKRKNMREKIVLFAPESTRARILKAAHWSKDAGHGGEARTAERVMLSYWWPGIHSETKEFVASCPRCQMAKAKLPPPAELQPLPICDGPNQRVHLDLMGPLKVSSGGRKYILVITDAFTKYTELAALTSKETQEVARAFFERWIIRFSVPLKIVTDQGKEFCSKTMDELAKLWGIDKARTSGFHPQSNSAAESYNRTIVKYMRAMLDNERTLEWEELLPFLQMAYNSHVHRSTKESPFFLTFLHDPRLPYFDIEKPQRTNLGDGYAAATMGTMKQVHEMVKTNMEEAERIRKEYYDRMTKERVFRTGDRVLVHFPNVDVGVNQKFFKRWRLYTVCKPVGPVNVLVRETQHKKPIIVHVNRVRHATQEDIKEACDSTQVEYEGQEVFDNKAKVDEETRKKIAEQRQKERMEFWKAQQFRHEGDFGGEFQPGRVTRATTAAAREKERRDRLDEEEERADSDQSFVSCDDAKDSSGSFHGFLSDEEEAVPDYEDPWAAIGSHLFRGRGPEPPPRRATRSTAAARQQDWDIPDRPLEYKQRQKK